MIYRVLRDGLNKNRQEICFIKGVLQIHRSFDKG